VDDVEPEHKAEAEFEHNCDDRARDGVASDEPAEVLT
jgi:hypothetical protein